ncbi:MAG: nitrous oxide reductase accessory protein NosL [Deltaproteobacteria bacterium]|nr:nitrous oxide reductase accessory protein NosL [Deltaproteobacteria bacterium]
MLFLVCLCLSAAASGQSPTDLAPSKPSAKDKCPVCGMFVAKYPDWTAQIVHKDGTRVYFDGAKDLFKYYFNINKYDSKKSRSDVASIWVTEYYDLRLIDGFKAYYVMGSTVYGPMGRELIPQKSKEEADEFMKDHGGNRVLTFDKVTPEMVRKLDE